MFASLWLSSLKRQLRPRFSHSARARRNRLQCHQLPSARALVSRNAAETLEDRTLLTSVFSIDDAVFSEGDVGIKEIIFTVTRTGVSPGDLNSVATVDFSTQDKTAKDSDNDYLAQMGSLSFAADSSAVEQTKIITIQVNGDVLTEGNETFEILLINNSIDTTIQKSIGTATITNDDSNAIHISDSAIPENEEFTFEITLDEVAGSDIVFWVRTHNGTADQDDFTFLQDKQVTIHAGELSTQVTVYVHDDNEKEDDETFDIRVTEVLIGGSSLPDNVEFTDKLGHGVIVNDDFAGRSVFRIEGTKVLEGQDGIKYLDFIIKREGARKGNLYFETSVHFSTRNGTAIAGEDYIADSQIITFSATSKNTTQSHTVRIPIIGDNYNEASETIIGTLSNPTDGSILKGNVSSLDAIGIIANDDSDYILQDSYNAEIQYGNYSYDQMGGVVAVDGDVMVVGVSHNQSKGRFSGAAYVYVRNRQGTPLDQSDDTWDYEALLQPESLQEFSYFGSSVGIYGNTIIVGAASGVAGSNNLYEAFYIFTRVGDDWKTIAPHMETVTSETPLYCQAVSIYENTIVIGASDAVYIYEKDGTNWNTASVQQLLPPEYDVFHYFGSTVSIYGDLIVVGSLGDDGNEVGSGAAYVYEKNGDDWTTNSPEVVKITASDGKASDRFGFSVATNGIDVAIGAYSTDDNGINTGSVYLYSKEEEGAKWSISSLNELKLLGKEYSGEFRNFYFGSSVFLTENQLLVGAYHSKTQSTYAAHGAAYLYTKNDVEWNLDTLTERVVTLAANEQETDARIVLKNKNVSISGTTIFIGALYIDSDGINSGAVYVYEAQDEALVFSDIVSNMELETRHHGGDEYGRVIAVSDNYMIVSAPSTDSSLAVTGVVYLYRKNDNEALDTPWVFETAFSAPDSMIIEFGTSLAIDGDIFLVGALLPSNESEVYIYEMNGSDWTTIAPTVTPLFSSVSRSVQFENAVAIDNDTIVVGNAADNSNGLARGSVFVYTRNGSDWSTTAPAEAVLAASAEFYSYKFGYAVDIEQNRIVVGAPKHRINGSSLFKSGAAYLFEKGETGWDTAVQTQILSSDIQGGDSFGTSVAISGNTIFIGSPGEDTAGDNAGAVYIFDISKNAADPEINKIVPIVESFSQAFGTTIDVYGDKLIVGTLPSVYTGSLIYPKRPYTYGYAYLYDGASGWESLRETVISLPPELEIYSGPWARGTGSEVAIFDNGFLVSGLLTNSDTDLKASYPVYNYNRVNTAEFHLRVVDSPTGTTPAGEVSSLPLNQESVTEWASYWVEIWVKSNDLDGQGVLSAELNLNYNTQYTSATDIEFGASFTQNQTGDIYEPSGIIAGLAAETTAADLGTDDYLLFARIKFESLAEDQVNLDLSGSSIGPRTLGFHISSEEVKLVGDITAVSNPGQFNSASIWANPFDLDDNDVINIRDLILFINQYSTIPSESNSLYAWFADYNQNDRVDVRDLISFIQNYGKSKANQSPVNYPPNYPDAWNQLLIVDRQSEPRANANTVTQSAAESVLESVVDQVSQQLTPRQAETLEQVDIEVVDLAGETLGRAAAGTIFIDVNAAGRGWFVDTSPADHSEFAYDSELTLIALPDSAAANGVDLWTVIMHELGHLLGHEHETDGVMQDTLAPSVRRLPGWAEETDSFFSDLTEDTDLIAF